MQLYNIFVFIIPIIQSIVVKTEIKETIITKILSFVFSPFIIFVNFCIKYVLAILLYVKIYLHYV